MTLLLGPLSMLHPSPPTMPPAPAGIGMIVLDPGQDCEVLVYVPGSAGQYERFQLSELVNFYRSTAGG